MDAYVVIAEVTVPPERLADFIAFSLEDARDSVTKEPGCQQFDMLSSADGSPTVVFYEVYDDQAAGIEFIDEEGDPVGIRLSRNIHGIDRINTTKGGANAKR